MPRAEIAYAELRGDWCRNAQTMARFVDHASRGTTRLLGFPAQWIPLFELVGADWDEAVPPPEPVPIISDLSFESLLDLIGKAKARNQLRTLVEGIASFDPLVADVLHQLDRRVGDQAPTASGRIMLTGWQSYGRPEIRDFNKRVLARASSSSPTAVLLPCARRRPYGGSKTHRRLLRGLTGLVSEGADQIVISSLGVVPQEFWADPVVLAYDSGVPDIYRVLRLMRAYFGRAPYASVVDCLEFEPYRDCLRIIQNEGLIGEIRPGSARKIKKLPQP